MKKLIPLLLAFAMLLSLCACGGGSDTTTSNNGTSATREIALGEVIATDNLEFALTRVEFADNLKYASFSTGTKPDEEYLLPTEQEQQNTTFVAEEGYTYISYSYSLKYTGKEEIEIQTDMGITADYNNGYIFEIFSDAYMWSEWIAFRGITKLKPLDPAGEGRGCIKVPLEVMENTDNPLKISVSLPNADGTTTDCVYIVR